MTKEKMKAIKGIIFVIGLIPILIGGITDWYDSKYGALVGLIIWFVGGAIVKYYFVKAKEQPKTPSEIDNSENSSQQN